MRTIQGTIVSNKMTRTVVVRVDRLVKHKKYLKFYRTSRKYKADVEDAKTYRLGDMVRMRETKPLSKDKRWKVMEVVRKADAEEVEGESESENAGDKQPS